MGGFYSTHTDEFDSLEPEPSLTHKPDSYVYGHLNTEENLQIAAYKLKQIITIHGLITSAQKTKLVPVRG